MISVKRLGTARMDKLFPTPLAKQNLKLSRSWFFEKLTFKSSREDVGVIKENNLTPEVKLEKCHSDKNVSALLCTNCGSPKMTQQHRSRSVCVSFSLEDEESRTVEEQELINLNIQKQILKAKAEARTVSAVDGDLYIDYKYVGRLPPGIRI